MSIRHPVLAGGLDLVAVLSMTPPNPAIQPAWQRLADAVRLHAPEVWRLHERLLAAANADVVEYRRLNPEATA